MAAPVIGTTIKVLVYPTHRDFERRANAVEMPANIISAGPPGAAGWWGRVPARNSPPTGRWLLVRPIPGGIPQQFYATLDDSNGK